MFKLQPLPQPEGLPTQYPVMLLHGFGAFSAVGRAGQLHKIAMHLREHGVLAYAPNVDPYNTTEARAQAWRQRLNHILHETGAEKVNLIAHSMGGLDARWLIQEGKQAPYIASLTTIATPHHGSSLAAYALKRPERLRQWIEMLMNWLGEVTYAETPPNYAAALEELTPAYITEQFNPHIPDHPEVHYQSYAAISGRETTDRIHPVMLFSNNIIFQREGLNDGMVSAASARWSGFVETISADHARQVGLSIWPSPFKALEFYRGLVKSLRERGF